MGKEFKPQEFFSTKFATGETKASFANWFVGFVTRGMKPEDFSQKRYRELSQMFGFIAHYDREGFVAEYFSSPARKVAFLEFITEDNWLIGLGDPTATWSDVEKALKNWLVDASVPYIYRSLAAMEHEMAERQQLAYLKEKYESS